MSAVKLTNVAPNAVTPDHIMQVGMGFWGSKVLLSAVELGVFTHLANGAMKAPELERAMALHPRATTDFLDSLVALGFLSCDGKGAARLYRNTPDTALFLDRNSPHYIGGILEMANARLYRFWADLTPALETGQPQNCLLYTSPSPRDRQKSRMPSSA